MLAASYVASYNMVLVPNWHHVQLRIHMETIVKAAWRVTTLVLAPKRDSQMYYGVRSRLIPILNQPDT